MHSCVLALAFAASFTLCPVQFVYFHENSNGDLNNIVLFSVFQLGFILHHNKSLQI